jgi:hypothetical protein
MANLWLGTGATVIGILLVVAALLPRPSAEYAISQLPFTVGSPEQQRSKAPSVPRDGTKDDEPGTAPDRQSQRRSEQEKADDTEPTPSDDDKGSEEPREARETILVLIQTNRRKGSASPETAKASKPVARASSHRRRKAKARTTSQGQGSGQGSKQQTSPRNRRRRPSRIHRQNRTTGCESRRQRRK